LVTLYVRLGDEEICATFQELSSPSKVKQIMIFEKGQEILCDVTGWKSEPEPSPTPAFAQKVTDSGDAQAILIHGGDLGILLKPENLNEHWNPESPNQIHRAYMVVSKDSVVAYEND
jgi:hypothetical protein